MDFQTIALLTLALLLVLALMIIGGLVLSARAFTQLAELVRFIGYSVAANKQEIRQVQTTLSDEGGKPTKSRLKEDTRTTPEPPD